MKLLKVTHHMTMAVFLAALIWVSCEKEKTTAKISGEIILQNTDIWSWYQDSGEVQLTIFPEFSLDPPAGWGAVPDGHLGPNVPGGTFPIGAPANAQNPLVFQFDANASTLSYELEVDPGTYSALALGFRHDLVTDPNLRTATLGVHWNNINEVSYGLKIPAFRLDYPAPAEFTVAAGDEININFTVDFGILPLWFR